MIVLWFRKETSENSDSEEEEDDVGEFPGRKEIVNFLHWLVYCDKVNCCLIVNNYESIERSLHYYLMICIHKILHLLLVVMDLSQLSLLQVVGVSEGVLGSSIVEAVRGVFLEGAVRAGLFSVDPDILSLYIALTTKIVASVTSPLLSTGSSVHCAHFIVEEIIVLQSCFL